MHLHSLQVRPIVSPCLLLLPLILLLAAPPLLTAHDRPPAAGPVPAVQSAINDALDVIYAAPTPQTLPAALRTVVERHFALESAIRRAVGPGWNQFDPGQQRRATELFAELVVRTYARSLAGSERPTTSFGEPSRLSATRSEVPTLVTYQGATYTVVYRLEQAARGWLIYDVVIEGISLISNYRSQFESLFVKGGPAGILSALESKARESGNQPPNH